METRLLLLEDEPLILMDLEYAACDRGFSPVSAHSCEEALALIEEHAETLKVAILDVSLGGGATCLPVARELERRSIPFILHSGDLDRQEETVRELSAELIAKPVPAEKVISAAIAFACGQDPDALRMAAE